MRKEKKRHNKFGREEEQKIENQEGNIKTWE